MSARQGPAHEWQQLTAAAVLGVNRVSGRLPTVEGAPAALLGSRVPDGSAALIRAASVLSIYERAGRRAKFAANRPARCEDDATPACSARAGHQLSRILHGEHGALLEEWCTLASAGGYRAPDETLPALLDRCLGKAAVEHEVIRAVLGRRGLWLAAMNPAWQAARSAGDSQTIWREGGRPERLVALRELRRRDSDAARAMAVETWDQESAEERVGILRTLGERLSPKDEPLLEAALDDSRKTVRLAAVELLCRLPASAFCRRMIDRAAALVRMGTAKRGLMGRVLSIDVTPPEKPDKLLLRDGIEPKRSGGMGEKAHVLCQILAATPLAHWEASGAAPAEILAAAADSDWQEPLLRGWTRAAARQGAAGWAEPILRRCLAAEKDADAEDAEPIVRQLAPADRERVLTSALGDRKVATVRSLALLSACAHDWTLEFSRVVLAALRKFFGTEAASEAPELRAVVRQRVARSISPALADGVESGWRTESKYWQWTDSEMVSALAATLAFRREMHEEMRG